MDTDLHHVFGIICIALFGVAYVAVAMEERLRMRKSAPVLLAAGAIWMLAGVVARATGQTSRFQAALHHDILAFAELFLFLLSAVTYVNTMEERQVFDALRAWLVRQGWSLRRLFWVTGALAFVLSPVLDNLTTTLVVGSVAIAIGGRNAGFIVAACVNIVVAANAGGAFSPFGDITTLMEWQSGKLGFVEFLRLFPAALVNWLIPALFLQRAARDGAPAGSPEAVAFRPGAFVVMILFAGTITLTVVANHLLGVPAAVGMMAGLGVLKVYSYALRERLARMGNWQPGDLIRDTAILAAFEPDDGPPDTFDIFGILRRFEWDTLMFFYGVILCVGGLATFGYLSALSSALYGGFGPTSANIVIGVVSAVVDNIPVMYAALTMDPVMGHSQWLLLTLTAGVGGSLLATGSAAGVALMGQASRHYTFRAHLKWFFPVALGYAASVVVHVFVRFPWSP
jgi:Na+/H+ antiporter NhaD/arsenite permease-like protein